MPSITINGKVCEFESGQTILQIANAHGLNIPQYCYHDGLSIVANCRICLAEIHAPDPRADGKIAPFMGGKLMPTCQTTAADGMVVFTESPKAIANQKAVMEYLLINHPLDCPVCDQAGECFLQDYSYQHGRGVSRFEEAKVKNPKKDLGPNVYLYADRCIMCTRCVRFTREVTGTAELMVTGRGNKEEIDVFPGVPLDNELSANVIDLCPVGALLDKDFLFAQRVWFLKSTPSIDGITASGDNIWIEHNEGKIYRFRPRENLAVNKWWITDEVRYGWDHVHSDKRLTTPMRREFGALVACDDDSAYADALDGLKQAAAGGKIALVLSPMLSCEDAYLLAKLARAIDSDAMLAVGPVPRRGEDKVFPPNADEDDPKAFKLYAEKAPNARGVRRVLSAIGQVHEFDGFLDAARAGKLAGVILTGNYPSEWATPELESALEKPFVLLIDTLRGKLLERANVAVAGAVWAEKAGTFENARGMLQAFEQAIPGPELARSEGQIALDLLVDLGEVEANTEPYAGYSVVDDGPGQVPTAVEVRFGKTRLFNAAEVRQEMALASSSLGVFTTDVAMAGTAGVSEGDMEVVEL